VKLFLSLISDALSTALSALYAKMVVILGIALPITEILSNRIPAAFYQGFYVYLYSVSIAFVVFVYASKLRQKAVQTIIKNYRELMKALCRQKAHWRLAFSVSDAKTSDAPKKKATQFGSFYLRIGAIAFGIGTMVYSGIELGQYFELESGDNNAGCHNVSGLGYFVRYANIKLEPFSDFHAVDSAGSNDSVNSANAVHL
jgi:Otopetrin